MSVLCTGFEVTEMLSANFSSALSASQGVTFSSTATLRTFHRNSKMPIMKEQKQPNASTTNTPPTFPMPSSAVSPGPWLAAASHRPRLPLMTRSRPSSLLLVNTDGRADSIAAHMRW
uniref:Uncharacterized protein n=1 Tax=Anopheles atroparvus TaxID=41427 RepID=A0AAG5DL19_ANOAO